MKYLSVSVLCAAFLLLFLRPSPRTLLRNLGSGRGGGLFSSLASSVTPSLPPLGEGQVRILYSPDTDLEREDRAVLDTAKSTIDAALYALTDQYICDALADAARRGVRVRVYRDRQQYEEEAARGAHARRSTCSAELVASGAQVKVKASTELMHLKSYTVDESVLRTGSANISPIGEKRQTFGKPLRRAASCCVHPLALMISAILETS
ncbi:MAG: phospholipase D-like domain-containing protein [Acidobacteriaceae bacterium]|nr:phospholipase D-like domain-containing protein [Acidobacteriaceae bacterium]